MLWGVYPEVLMALTQKSWEISISSNRQTRKYCQTVLESLTRKYNMVFETFLLNGLTKFRFLNGFDLVPSIPHPHKMGWWTLLKITFQWGPPAPHTWYLPFPLHRQDCQIPNFTLNIPKIYPKKVKYVFFCVQSGKIYTWQNFVTRAAPPPD